MTNLPLWVKVPVANTTLLTTILLVWLKITLLLEELKLKAGAKVICKIFGKVPVPLTVWVPVESMNCKTPVTPVEFGSTPEIIPLLVKSP